VEKSKHTRGELISTMGVAIPPTGVESEVLRYNKQIHFFIAHFGNKGNKDTVELYDFLCNDAFRLYSASGILTLVGTIKVDPGQWYHLAYVYGGTTVSIYVNGELSASKSDFPPSYLLSTSRDTNFFGKDLLSRYSNVQLDEIKIYKKWLTQSQVKLDMETGSTSSSQLCQTAETSRPTITTTRTTTKRTTTTTTIQTTTTTVTTRSTTTVLYPSCITHYWPIQDDDARDVIGGKNAYSYSPQFAEDRMGFENGSILINSRLSGWQLPDGVYFQGDTTLTLWVNKVECGTGSSYGYI
jgi:hypothetical protein